MRKCPFNGCTKQLLDHIFACGPHWHRLSGEQKRAVYAAYTDYLDDRITNDELREAQQGVLDFVPGGPHHA